MTKIKSKNGRLSTIQPKHSEQHKNKEVSMRKKLLAISIAAVMALSVAGCGGGGGGTDDGSSPTSTETSSNESASTETSEISKGGGVEMKLQLVRMLSIMKTQK